MTVRDFPSSPFWDFSVTFYAKPGVAATCLRLQERHGIDINLLLLCFWRASLGMSFSPADLQHVQSSVQQWHNRVVRSLRAVRSELKTDSFGAPGDLAEPLRESVKEIELKAEWVEQSMIEAAISSKPETEISPPDLVSVQLMENLRQLGLFDDAEDRADITILVETLGFRMPAEPR